MKETRGQVLSLSAHASALSGASLSDVALIASCAAGDAAALGPLFDCHADATARFLARLGHVAPHEVEDLVHDVFIALMKTAARYERGASVRTWILAIAANMARQAARSSLRARSFMARACLVEVREPSRQPDDEASQRRLVAALESLVAELPHDLRVAFVMADVEALPGVEAARALGIPTGTFYRRLHEARSRLREGLEADARDPQPALRQPLRGRS